MTGDDTAVAKIATQMTVRTDNARTAFEAIESRPPLTRADIARMTGMTKPTAANALDVLLAAGLVRPVAEPPAGAHYAAVFFEPDPAVAAVVGIDASGRHVRGTIADLRGTVLERHDVELHGADLAGGLRALRTRLARHPLWPRVAAAVAGVPGLIDAGRGRIWETSVAEWEDLPIATLAEALGLPVEVENDVNLAALGERASGAGRSAPDFAYLAVGAGVGAGLILGGRLHRGHHGAAGEIDFPDGRAEGNPGTPSAAGLLATARRRLARWTGPTVLAEPVTVDGVFTAYTAGDALADEILWELARRIARAVTPIARVADVGLIVLGGEIGGAHPVLVDRLGALTARISPCPPRIAASQLGDAGVLTGAVAVAARAGRARVLNERLGG